MASSSSSSTSTAKHLSNAAKALQAVAKPAVAALTVVIPFLITTTKKMNDEFQKLPQNAMLFVYGIVFCFFGGTFPTLFAALQAAEYGGRKEVWEALMLLADEATIIIDESKKDDSADEDKDGKKDVDQISGTDFLARKTKLVLRKMNPDKIDKAISSLYRVWLAVAAVLSIQFARTISMALVIAEFLEKPAGRFIAPTLQLAIPDEYDRWVPVVLGWIAKGIAMSIAWYIQSVISAVASALKGGLMMARAFYQFCIYRELKLFGLIPDDHTKSVVDEMLSYIFAGLGFYFQFRAGFKLPFPFNVVLWPFNWAEYYIRWSLIKK
jgi:hypothetical protein